MNHFGKNSTWEFFSSSEDEAKAKGQLCYLKITTLDFPGGTVVKNPPANAGDTGSSPGWRRSHMLWSN